ncbi:MAG: MBL fold metallo-hydrolase [Dehalococcoidia bacterium]|nr:MBL fold metallo-hydrolase [Dehalococcoidia bacterium]
MSTSLGIGEFEITTVQDHQGMDRNPVEIYPAVPALAWDPYREFALDPDGFYRSQWRGHLISSSNGDRAILVDTGMGPGPHDHTGKPGELPSSLNALGVSPEEIGIVVITHTHGDHIGWNVSYDAGVARATFPNARYLVARADWDHYSAPENSNEAFEHSIRPLEALGVLDLVEGVHEIRHGVSTLPTNGHTPGHQCVLVESNGETGVVTGDLFHNVAQISEPDWCPIFDWDTTISTRSRRELLDRAEREGWTVFSGHLGIDKSIGKIVRIGETASWSAL